MPSIWYMPVNVWVPGELGAFILKVNVLSSALVPSQHELYNDLVLVAISGRQVLTVMVSQCGAAAPQALLAVRHT